MRKGWDKRKLGDISELVTKGTTPTSVGFDFVPSGINFLKVESISSTGEFIQDKFAHITWDCHESLKRSQLEPGDILFSIAGALGRTAIVTSSIIPANTNQALAIIRLKKGIGVFDRFVLAALQAGSIFEQIEKFKGGVAQLNLSLAQVRDLLIPLPPLEEQQRIVSILDEAFAGLASAQAHAARNLQNARALFESHLQAVFTQRGEGWIETTVGDLIEKYGGEIKTGPFGTKLKASEYTENGVPVISVGEIRLGEIVLHDRTPKVDKTITSRMPEYTLEEGDIVFGRKGAVERSASVKKHQSGWFLGSDGIRLRLPSNSNPQFIGLQLLSTTHREWIINQSVGTTMPSLNQKIIAQIPIVTCPIDLQNNIVTQLDGLATETQHLTRIYEQKLAALAALKKSLLHRAFSGEL